MSNDHLMDEKDAANDAKSNRVWPGKLNIALIGIGVLAFGLIIVDRLVSMLSVDDLPDTVEIERSVETEVASGEETESSNTLSDSTSTSTSTATSAASSVSATGSTTDATSAATADGDAETKALLEAHMAEYASSDSVSPDSVPSIDANNPSLDIESVFGGRLVFVSSAAPLYVMTEDERRIDVGSSIDAQTTLAGLTSDQIILEMEGNLVAIELPVPSAN